MLAVDRRHRILERVAEQQTIHIRELAAELGVSEMTIRRDITRLERDGFLRRTYGGATAHVTRSLELAFNARALQSASAKRLIGMAAAPLVAGARRHELCCVGPVASATVRRYHADVAVLSAAGLSARAGMTELDDETAEVHRLMTEHSDALVAVADGSKLGAVAAAVVVPIEAITTLVTDETAEAGEREALRARGVNVMVAPRAPDRRARASANGARAEGGT